MQRFAHTVVVAFSCASTAFTPAQAAGATPPVPGSIADHGFPATIAREIYKIIPGDRSSFVLTEDDASNPVFPGKGLNKFEQVDCERTAGYRVIGFANVQGRIAVAVCGNGQRVQDVCNKVPERLDALFKDSTASREEVRASGWYYAHAVLSNRLEFHYFPVIEMGHGVLTHYTGAVFDKITKRAVVVRISPHPMCATMANLYRDFPLCVDREATLRKLATGIAQRYVTGN